TFLGLWCVRFGVLSEKCGEAQNKPIEGRWRGLSRDSSPCSRHSKCSVIFLSYGFFKGPLSCAHSRSDSITGRHHVAPAPYGPILCVFPACGSRRPMIHFIKFYQIMLTVEWSELCQSEDRSRRSHAITRWGVSCT